MNELENPYICFNCAKVGKCKDTIRHTHDPNACKNFELYKEVKFTRVSIQKLAELLGTTSSGLRGRIKCHGWKYVVDLFRTKGITIYREKSGALDKRYESNKYVYYIKE